MGGDDLGSDEEYLFDAGLVGPPGGRGTAVSSSDDGDGGSVSSASEVEGDSPPPAPQSKKRRGDAAPPASASKKKRRKKADRVNPNSSRSVVIHAGRGIAADGPDAQAAFLGALYAHALRMAEGADARRGGGADGDDGEGDESGDDRSPAKPFSFLPHMHSPSGPIDAKTDAFNHTNLAAFLTSGVLPSKKRLKNWRHPRSPMVLVVTLSARRSVELMKQLSTLRLPVAKLFAKHMTVEDQARMLSDGVGGKAGKNNPPGGKSGKKGGGRGAGGRRYSLAVGTPGRMLKLLRHREEGRQGPGALHLKHTEVIVIDCHEDSKGWTVCTLNDTSRELMELLREGAVPEWERRGGRMRLAMF